MAILNLATSPIQPTLEPTEVNLETDSVQIVEKQFRDTPKFASWVEYMTDKENRLGKDTFGNQVQSAIHAYNLDPVSQYKSASVIGHQNLDKLRTLASTYYAKNGLTFGTMLDIAAGKMAKSNSPQWWMIVAELMGLIEPQGKLIPIQQTTQINISSETLISREEQDKWDKEFLLFLENRKVKI